MTELLGMAASQVVNQAGFFVFNRQPTVALQVIPETGVVAQPPERGLRDQEEIGSVRPQALELSDGFRRLGGINVRVISVVLLGKMPGAVSVQFEQFVVSFADDYHGRLRRQLSGGRLADAPPQARVLRRHTSSMRFPLPAPLVFKAAPVGFKDGIVLTVAA